jgi:multiple sugar transport system permease protein
MAAHVRNVAPSQQISQSSFVSRRMRRTLAVGTLTLFATLIVMIYLMPFTYSAATSLRDKNAAQYTGAPLWPAQPAKLKYENKDLDIYFVGMPDGTERRLAMYKPGRKNSTFINPDNTSEQVSWEGNWRNLPRDWSLQPSWTNYSEAFKGIKFPQLFRNTLVIAIVGTLGTLISSTLVAYGFSRFRIPGKTILFMILMGTIILPPQVTLVPTYTIFTKLGWVNTWLPLLVPHFFANAYNVFLLRQFFMGIPREMDEAAMMDGAGPLRTLISIILPQSIPVVISVALFHFFFAWNDFFGPLIYLVDRKDLQPISVGIMRFNGQYSQQPQLIQAAAIMAMGLPILVFLVAQRFFMQGVVVTGVEK